MPGARDRRSARGRRGADAPQRAYALGNAGAAAESLLAVTAAVGAGGNGRAIRRLLQRAAGSAQPGAGSGSQH